MHNIFRYFFFITIITNISYAIDVSQFVEQALNNLATAVKSLKIKNQDKIYKNGLSVGGTLDNVPSCNG